METVSGTLVKRIELEKKLGLLKVGLAIPSVYTMLYQVSIPTCTDFVEDKLKREQKCSFRKVLQCILQLSEFRKLCKWLAFINSFVSNRYFPVTKKHFIFG